MEKWDLMSYMLNSKKVMEYMADVSIKLGLAEGRLHIVCGDRSELT